MIRVGDWVRVKTVQELQRLSTVEDDIEVDGISLIPSMRDLCGKVLQVPFVSPACCALIVPDGRSFYYSFKMVEKLPFKPDDWVRIKSWKKLKKILDSDRHTPSGVYFNPRMDKYCGLVVRIASLVPFLHRSVRAILVDNPVFNRLCYEDGMDWQFSLEMIEKVEGLWYR